MQALTVFTIKYMTLMDVGRGLIQMQGPVEDVVVLSEPAVKLFKEFRRDFCEVLRWRGLLHRPNLDQRFFRSGLFYRAAGPQ